MTLKDLKEGSVLIYKKFEEIGINDIHQLMMNSVQEGKTIEYKLMLPGGNDQERKEFLADVSSFANTMGGDLIYGIEEENGIPKKIVGVELSDVDAEIRRLDNMIRDGIEPRIITNIKSIATEDSKMILLLRIPKSWNSPHRVIFKRHDKFYARNSGGKYSLDTSELRLAFTSSYVIEEKIRKFRNERVHTLMFNETPIPLEPGPKIILHVIPIDALSRNSNYDIFRPNMNSILRPIRATGWNSRINFEGLVLFTGNGSPSYSYVQLYRNGIIEAVNISILSFNSVKKYIPSLAYEEALIESLNNYLEALREMEVTIPLFCFLSFAGIKGYRLGLSSSWQDSYDIEKENLLLPETIIDNYDLKAETILKPSFDLVWNACGLQRSFNYDKNGNWSPRH